MSINLLDLLKGYLNDDVVRLASVFLGEGESSTQSAVMQALPTLLSGLMQKASTEKGANSLVNMLNDRTHDGSILGNVADIFGGGDKTNAYLRMGSSVLGNIFGDKVGGVVDLISSGSGLRRESSSNILSLIAPILLGLLGKTKKDNGLNASGLLSLVLGQGSFIKDMLPAGLGSLLGFTSIDALSKTALSNLSGTYKDLNLNLGSSSGSSYSSTSTSKTSSSSDNSGGGMGWLPWLLLPLLALGLFFWWKGCGSTAEKTAHNAAQQVGQTVEGAAQGAGQAVQGAAEGAAQAAQSAGQAVQGAAEGAAQAAEGAGQAIGDAATKAWAALGKMFSHKLPNGVTLNIPELGVEKRLITFIEDKAKAVDKTTWFDFDRLLFETGKNTLRPESQEQVKNIAEVLKAFPKVEVKIGGYTDNTGDANANLKLSQERATTVMNELVKLGIDAKRMTAEGYGIQHPVATNDTPEGREKNRRVSLRVTKK